MRNRTITGLAALAFVTMACGAAAAAAEPMDEQVEVNAWAGALSIGFGGVARSEFRDHDAQLEMSVGTIDLRIGSLISSVKLLRFDWMRPADSEKDTGGRDFWDHLYQADVGLYRDGLVSDRMSYQAMLGISTAFEKQPNDALSGYGGAFGVYCINPMWMVSFGAFYSRHQEIATDYDFVPILGLSWNPAAQDGFSFNLGLPSTDATWHFSDRTRLALALNYTSEDCGVYRLADDSRIREKGYVEISGSTVTLCLDTRLRNNLALSMGVSQSIAREFTFHDTDGANEQTHNVQNQPGLMIALSQSF
jgi:hypothetical protein